MIKNVLKRILTAAVFLAFGLAASAQQADTLSAKIYFHRAMYNIDLNYESNGRTLSTFVTQFRKIYGYEPSGFDFIMIRTGCSPEGGIGYNEQLSFNRAKSIRDYLVANLGISASQVRIDPVGIDWSGLREEMAKQYFPGRWDMYALMDRYGVKSSYERGDEAKCQLEMMRDRGGEPWRWMLANIFPRLRSGEGEITVVAEHPVLSSKPVARKAFDLDSNSQPTRRDTVVIIHRDTIYYVPTAYKTVDFSASPAPAAAVAPIVMPRTFREIKREQRDSLLRVPVMALRSNMFIPAMNVGVEVPIGNRWSVGFDWYYPWVWRSWMNSIYPAQMQCTQFLGGYLETRYWFGSRHTPGLSNARYRLSGHSLAVTGVAGYYDYGQEWSGKQGEFAAFGLDYMYSVILGRGNAHMDFDLGLGYYQMKSRNYDVYEVGGKLYGDRNQNLPFGSFLPIKAGVSIVLPIFKQQEVKLEDAE